MGELIIEGDAVFRADLAAKIDTFFTSFAPSWCQPKVLSFISNAVSESAVFSETDSDEITLM